MAYTKVGWSSSTPVNAANLAQMDQGIKDNASLLDDHNSRHQDGGADEINVGGLSGVLSDAQPPQNHAGEHENGGSDTISDLPQLHYGGTAYSIEKNGSDGAGVINFKT